MVGFIFQILIKKDQNKKIMLCLASLFPPRQVVAIALFYVDAALFRGKDKPSCSTITHQIIQLDTKNSYQVLFIIF
jgi:hypothetical protein